MTIHDRPVPVRTSSRTCFGIEWYASEEEALLAAKLKPGRINGGWYDGQYTGRDSGFDGVDPDTGDKLFAITVP